MKLKYRITREIQPTAPFNFDATFHKPDHFPSGDNYWELGARWQTWRWEGMPLGLKLENGGDTKKPLVQAAVYSDRLISDKLIDDDFLSRLKQEIIYRYNLNLDLTEFCQLFSGDKILGPVIKRWRGMRPGHQSSLYEYLIIGILLQNCTVRRSIQMMQALFEKYGTQLEFDGKKLWCFWEPGALAKVSEEELRSLKIGYRAKFIKKIDEQFGRGEIDEMKLRRSDMEAQKRELLKLYGVGPATVWYLLFDVFHRYDFFEHISPWEQKIYSKLFFNKDSEKPVPVKKLLKYFEKYGKYRLYSNIYRLISNYCFLKIRR